MSDGDTESGSFRKPSEYNLVMDTTVPEKDLDKLKKELNGNKELKKEIYEFVNSAHEFIEDAWLNHAGEEFLGTHDQDEGEMSARDLSLRFKDDGTQELELAVRNFTLENEYVDSSWFKIAFLPSGNINMLVRADRPHENSLEYEVELSNDWNESNVKVIGGGGVNAGQLASDLSMAASYLSGFNGRLDAGQ